MSDGKGTEYRLTTISERLIMAGLLALSNGVLLWFFWPMFVSTVMPGTVSRGLVADHLSFWDALRLATICLAMSPSLTRWHWVRA